MLKQKSLHDAYLYISLGNYATDLMILTVRWQHYFPIESPFRVT